ncbi:MAG TPA: type VI secretion system protein TssA [Gammaproteobacteria bacterium]|uniref:type VI secretion system protein TssA n=1 Tax=unclassified Ketobacter TaxID=2639109 RepID=UPI000C61510C|nr:MULTISPECIES: type VI secretion system protein TssA [unclassified Ketobacter]MBI25444.1 type VI secretion system protein TssA [Pseudomonadales bacterium]MEC8811995.1 type VI secretion system protein TssA [Pseudomonadota bacterium]HAG95342.1 type VI secretion system protein TssA [Gammaproteobacteria bacterium]MCK5792736.1 type VI secretion system protein TssA [Ketobacter sp.]RLT89583.1 MAG: type VI secretion system protein TssA [Ketobacter sp. GenoA1]|tara:strand:+ start:8524 stop:9744 length:1221 start_codon:yes stop_codon:yes gene_type:complete
MASPHIIDIDELLQPISADSPQGSDIREDSSPTSLYYQIKDARNAARAAERASLFDPDEASNVLNEWRPILDLAPTILKENSKDLEVASWLLEALIRFHDFPGLRDGIQLTRGLVDQYWDGLYPEPDEDGIETKVAPLAGLNGDSGEGTLLAPMRNALITTESSVGAFSYWQYQQARDAAKISDPDKRQEKEDTLGFTLAAIETAVAEASADYYVNLVDDLEQAVADFKAMNDTLREHCKHEAPPYSLILETLEEILRAVRFLAKDKLAAAAPEEITVTEEASTNGAPATAAPRSTGPSGPIGSRDDALRRLEEVAQFFRATEPHTPLVTGIERLVRWGRMPMSELILELVPDPTARAFYQHLTGAKLNESDDPADVAAYNATASTVSESQHSAADDAQEDNNVGW